MDEETNEHAAPSRVTTVDTSDEDHKQSQQSKAEIYQDLLRLLGAEFPFKRQDDTLL